MYSAKRYCYILRPYYLVSGYHNIFASIETKWNYFQGGNIILLFNRTYRVVKTIPSWFSFSAVPCFLIPNCLITTHWILTLFSRSSLLLPLSRFSWFVSCVVIFYSSWYISWHTFASSSPLKQSVHMAQCPKLPFLYLW